MRFNTHLSSGALRIKRKTKRLQILHSQNEYRFHFSLHPLHVMIGTFQGQKRDFCSTDSSSESSAMAGKQQSTMRHLVCPHIPESRGKATEEVLTYKRQLASTPNTVVCSCPAGLYNLQNALGLLQGNRVLQNY